MGTNVKKVFHWSGLDCSDNIWDKKVVGDVLKSSTSSTLYCCKVTCVCVTSRTLHRCHFPDDFLLYLSRSGGAGSRGERAENQDVVDDDDLGAITRAPITQTEGTHTQPLAACVTDVFESY